MERYVKLKNDTVMIEMKISTKLLDICCGDYWLNGKSMGIVFKNSNMLSMAFSEPFLKYSQ